MKIAVVHNLPGVKLESKYCNTGNKMCKAINEGHGLCTLFGVHVYIDNKQTQYDYDRIKKCSACLRACAIALREEEAKNDRRDH